MNLMKHISDNTERVVISWKKAILTSSAVIAVLIVALIVNAVWIKTYSSKEAYTGHGGTLFFEIPEDAKDLRFAIRNMYISRQYLYSFSLSKEDYRDYLEQLTKQYKLDSEDEEEKAYGYAHWYGIKVADCKDAVYSLNDFPTGLPFDKVTDGSIEDYTIIVYSPAGTGGHSYGLVTDSDSCRIVCYDFYGP